MAKTRSDGSLSSDRRYPGPTPFHQAMNCIGTLIFERGRRGDLDFSVSTRRVGPATTITVYHPGGVMAFTFTDEELAADDARRAKQAEARKRKR